jgi:hypothetical protein
MINCEEFSKLSEKEQRLKINSLINYFIAEGIIIEDAVSKKIRLTTEEELNNQIENV